jgi:hypothetical protein
LSMKVHAKYVFIIHRRKSVHVEPEAVEKNACRPTYLLISIFHRTLSLKPYKKMRVGLPIC